MARSIFNKRTELVQVSFTLDATTPVSMSWTSPTFGTYDQIVVTGSVFYCVSGTVGSTFYSSFCESLEYALETSANSVSEGIDWDVSYNPQQGYLTIRNSFEDFTIEVKAGLSAAVLGFTAGSHTTSVQDQFGFYIMTGSIVPQYVWRSQYDGRDDLKRHYEDSSVWLDHVADDGTVFSYGNESQEEMASWRWKFEFEEHIRSQNANSSEPWTWEHFVTYVRANKPWTLHTGSVTSPTWQNKEGIYRMKAESARFAPDYHETGWQDWLHIPVLARVVGSGSGNGLF